MAEDTKMNALSSSKSLLDAFCTFNNILATAKSLPEALNVLLTTHPSDADAKQEALSMQLHIGLDGQAHTVPLKHGAGMVGLRKTVLRMTGIPVDEQKYIFVDDTRLVDNDCPLPTDQPLRCVRTTTSSDDGDEQTPDVSEDASDKGSSESEDSSKYDFKWSDDLVEPGESWADASEGLIEGYGSQRSSAQSASSFARRFTNKWRRWNERMRQHQFYISIPEQHREKLQVTKRIRRACSTFYKAGQIMIRMRGRGSGYLEGKYRKESTDPLMICLSGREPYSLDDYWETFYKISAFLEEVLYANFNRCVVRGKPLGRELHIDDHSVHGGAHCEFLHRALPAAHVHDACDHTRKVDAELSWAWEFTQNWRQWNEWERQHQFYIAIPEQCRDELKVAIRLKRACKHIYKEHVMIRLRGKGSGFLEGKRKKESSDPLMICISGREPYVRDDYWNSFYKISALLEADIYADYNRSLGSTSKKGSQVHLQYEFVNSGARQGGRT